MNPYKQSNCITDGQRLALLCFSRGPVDRSGLVSLARWGTEGLQLPINSSNNKSIWMENELVGFRTCFPRTGKTGKPGSRGKTKLGRTAPSPPAPPPHRPRGSRTARAAPAPRDPPARPASPMLTIAELRTSSGLTRLQPPGVQRAEQRERAVTMALPGRKMAGEELPLCSPGLLRPDSGFDGREKTRSGTVLGLH